MEKFSLSLNDVKNLLEDRKNVVLSKKLSADLLNPVLALLKIKRSHPDYHFLFESVEKDSKRGRYSAIGIMPDLIFKSIGQVAYINDQKVSGNPLEILRKIIGDSKIESAKNLPSMSSGIFGFLGYDMARLMEKLPDRNLKDEIGVADSIFIRPQILIIFDELFDTMSICAPIYFEEKIAAESLYNKAVANIEKTIEILNSNYQINSEEPVNSNLDFKSNFSEEGYCAAVNKAKEFIKNGDIFQVLPSQRFTSDFDQKNSFSFYRSLRSINPSPFLFYLKFPDFVLTGSSPEIMVALHGNKVTIRPLAGTRKRGETAAENKKIAAELLADEKEVAEHLMLIDLGRHDVGKVCKAGSVVVTEKMIVENYSHVMHISSNVEGVLDKKFDALDALISGFPAGTVSGAPKIRAMEIIEELESEKRGFYAGCVGYFSGNGDMETCITLRSALIKNNKIYLQAGAGVVFDSVPKSEFEECLNKAKALMKAAEKIGDYLE